jgi:hypothetical protein
MDSYTITHKKLGGIRFTLTKDYVGYKIQATNCETAAVSINTPCFQDSMEKDQVI